MNEQTLEVARAAFRKWMGEPADRHEFSDSQWFGFLAGFKAALETHPEDVSWISLKDRHPEKGATVVVWDAMFQRPEVLQIEWRDLDPDYTHWIPLPSGPLPQAA